MAPASPCRAPLGSDIDSIWENIDAPMWCDFTRDEFQHRRSGYIPPDTPPECDRYFERQRLKGHAAQNLCTEEPRAASTQGQACPKPCTTEQSSPASDCGSACPAEMQKEQIAPNHGEQPRHPLWLKPTRNAAAAGRAGNDNKHGRMKAARDISAVVAAANRTQPDSRDQALMDMPLSARGRLQTSGKSQTTSRTAAQAHRPASAAVKVPPPQLTVPLAELTPDALTPGSGPDSKSAGTPNSGLDVKASGTPTAILEPKPAVSPMARLTAGVRGLFIRPNSTSRSTGISSQLIADGGMPKTNNVASQEFSGDTDPSAVSGVSSSAARAPRSPSSMSVKEKIHMHEAIVRSSSQKLTRKGSQEAPRRTVSASTHGSAGKAGVVQQTSDTGSGRDRSEPISKSSTDAPGEEPEVQSAAPAEPPRRRSVSAHPTPTSAARARLAAHEDVHRSMQCKRVLSGAPELALPLMRSGLGGGRDADGPVASAGSRGREWMTVPAGGVMSGPRLQAGRKAELTAKEGGRETAFRDIRGTFQSRHPKSLDRLAQPKRSVGLTTEERRMQAAQAEAQTFKAKSHKNQKKWETIKTRGTGSSVSTPRDHYTKQSASSGPRSATNPLQCTASTSGATPSPRPPTGCNASHKALGTRSVRVSSTHSVATGATTPRLSGGVVSVSSDAPVATVIEKRDLFDPTGRPSPSAVPRALLSHGSSCASTCNAVGPVGPGSLGSAGMGGGDGGPGTMDSISSAPGDMMGSPVVVKGGRKALDRVPIPEAPASQETTTTAAPATTPFADISPMNDVTGYCCHVGSAEPVSSHPVKSVGTEPPAASDGACVSLELTSKLTRGDTAGLEGASGSPLSASGASSSASLSRSRGPLAMGTAALSGMRRVFSGMRLRPSSKDGADRSASKSTSSPASRTPTRAAAAAVVPQPLPPARCESEGPSCRPAAGRNGAASNASAAAGQGAQGTSEREPQISREREVAVANEGPRTFVLSQSSTVHGICLEAPSAETRSACTSKHSQKSQKAKPRGEMMNSDPGSHSVKRTRARVVSQRQPPATRATLARGSAPSTSEAHAREQKGKAADRKTSGQLAESKRTMRRAQVQPPQNARPTSTDSTKGPDVANPAGPHDPARKGPSSDRPHRPKTALPPGSSSAPPSQRPTRSAGAVATPSSQAGKRTGGDAGGSLAAMAADRRAPTGPRWLSVREQAAMFEQRGRSLTTPSQTRSTTARPTPTGGRSTQVLPFNLLSDTRTRPPRYKSREQIEKEEAEALEADMRSKQTKSRARKTTSSKATVHADSKVASGGSRGQCSKSPTAPKRKLSDRAAKGTIRTKRIGSATRTTSSGTAAVASVHASELPSGTSSLPADDSVGQPATAAPREASEGTEGPPAGGASACQGELPSQRPRQQVQAKRVMRTSGDGDAFVFAAAAKGKRGGGSLLHSGLLQPPVAAKPLQSGNSSPEAAACGTDARDADPSSPGGAPRGAAAPSAVDEVLPPGLTTPDGRPAFHDGASTGTRAKGAKAALSVQRLLKAAAKLAAEGAEEESEAAREVDGCSARKKAHMVAAACAQGVADSPATSCEHLGLGVSTAASEC